MNSEPTSAKTYEDLILAVAIQQGVAYYGDEGGEVAQIPIDVFDLSECKRHVNNGISMFLMDAPPQGWRCMEPILDVALWPSVAVTAGVTVSSAYRPATDDTLITASEASFYKSMELRTLTVTDVNDLEIQTYITSTTVTVSGDQHWVGAKTFSVISKGAYTLPATFGGEYDSDITYVAGSNTGRAIEWTSEIEIRRIRQGSNTTTGTPTQAAVRKMEGQARRWELAVWPTPSSVVEVQFRYNLYFDTLTNLTDLHPAGFKHDETITAACKAVAERDADDLAGGEMNSYYRQICLPKSYQADGRSGPRNLGYCGNPGRVRVNGRNFRYFQRRPTVVYDTP